MEDSQLVYKPHLFVRTIVVLLSIMVILLSGLLLLIPPVGTVIGAIIFLSVIIFNINLMTSMIIINEDKFVKQSLFHTVRIDLNTFVEFKSMKVVGTVANSPIAIRYFILKTTEREVKVSTLAFRWQDILDILDHIERKYGNSE